MLVLVYDVERFVRPLRSTPQALLLIVWKVSRAYYARPAGFGGRLSRSTSCAAAGGGGPRVCEYVMWLSFDSLFLVYDPTG